MEQPTYRGELGNLQSIIDEALEQHRISRFFTIRPKHVI